MTIYVASKIYGYMTVKVAYDSGNRNYGKMFVQEKHRTVWKAILKWSCQTYLLRNHGGASNVHRSSRLQYRGRRWEEL